MRLTEKQAKQLNIGQEGKPKKAKLPKRSKEEIERERNHRRAMLTAAASHCLPNPLFEYQFAQPRKWAFDLAWPSRKVALEIEGGIWTEGRHVRGQGFLNDMEKYNEAALCGWLLLRTTWERINDGSAFALARRAFDSREQS